MRSKKRFLNILVALIIALVIQGLISMNLHKSNWDSKSISIKPSANDNDYTLIWTSAVLIGDIDIVDVANDIDKDGKDEVLASNGYRVSVFEYNETQLTFSNDGNINTDTVWAMCYGGDLDYDGKEEVISGSTNRVLYVSEYNPTSHTYDNVYSYLFASAVECVCIGNDLDKDGRKEIIAGTYDNKLTVLEFNGTDNGYDNVWQTTLASSAYRLDFGNDLDKDGKGEILVRSYDGKLTIFENTGPDSYSNVWESGSLISGLGSVHTGYDIDGDGKSEILVSGDTSQKVYIFEFNGVDNGYSKVWDSGSTIGLEVTSACIGNDLDDDGFYEILAGASNGKIFAFEFNGTDNVYKKVWDSGTTIGETILSLSIGNDLDEDGNKEFIAGSTTSKVYIFEYNPYSIPVLPNNPPSSFELLSNAGTPDEDGKFTLIWTCSDRANNYSIYQHSSYITEINESLSLLVEETDASSLLISGYSTGIYYFKGVAFNEYGNSYSNCIEIVVNIPQPELSGAPGSFVLSSNTGTSDDDGEFTLIWTISSGANNYSIYQHSSNITEINSSLTLLAEEIDNFLHELSNYPNGVYYFIAVAFNDAGNTTSNCISITVDIPSDAFRIPGYNLVIFSLLVGIISVVLIRKKLKLK